MRSKVFARSRQDAREGTKTEQWLKSGQLSCYYFLLLPIVVGRAKTYGFIPFLWASPDKAPDTKHSCCASRHLEASALGVGWEGREFSTTKTCNFLFLVNISRFGGKECRNVKMLYICGLSQVLLNRPCRSHTKSVPCLPEEASRAARFQLVDLDLID